MRPDPKEKIKEIVKLSYEAVKKSNDAAKIETKPFKEYKEELTNLVQYIIDNPNTGFKHIEDKLEKINAGIVKEIVITYLQ